MESKPTGDWMKMVEAASFLSVSRWTVDRRGIPWQAQPVPFKIRVKYLCLGDDTRELPRFFRPDVEALLKEKKQS